MGAGLAVATGATLATIAGWLAERPWGSFGEWFGGIATAGAIAVALYIQRTDHRREEARAAERSAADYTRQHLAGLQQVERDLRVHVYLEPVGSLDETTGVLHNHGSKVEVSLLNSGKRPYYLSDITMTVNRSMEVGMPSSYVAKADSMSILLNKDHYLQGVFDEDQIHIEFFVTDTLNWRYRRHRDGSYSRCE